MVLGKARSGGGNEPLGDVRGVRTLLAASNASGDGTAASAGIERLHGPGFTIDLPTTNPSVTQLVASLHDESYAWPVLERLCKGNGWMLMDMESGRTLSFSGA